METALAYWRFGFFVMLMAVIVLSVIHFKLMARFNTASNFIYDTVKGLFSRLFK